MVPVYSVNNPFEFCWVRINCNPENKQLKVETKYSYLFIIENINDISSNG